MTFHFSESYECNLDRGEYKYSSGYGRVIVALDESAKYMAQLDKLNILPEVCKEKKKSLPLNTEVSKVVGNNLGYVKNNCKYQAVDWSVNYLKFWGNVRGMNCEYKCKTNIFSALTSSRYIGCYNGGKAPREDNICDSIKPEPQFSDTFQDLASSSEECRQIAKSSCKNLKILIEIQKKTSCIR